MFSMGHVYDNDIPDDLSESGLSALYDELIGADQEHGDVSVTDEETGWYISAHRDGRVVMENLNDEGPAKHLHPVTKAFVLDLWSLLLAGDYASLHAHPWQAGYH